MSFGSSRAKRLSAELAEDQLPATFSGVEER